LKEALKEAEILKLLHGLPFMVQILGSAYESPYFFIFTEFYPGGTLSSNTILCGRDPMIPDSEVVWRARFRVLQQIKEGLATIHELGIVHGDIKPANMLFDETGKVRIGDFGTAEYVRHMPGKSIPLCLESGPRGLENFSIPYMAPELLHGDRVSFASDIWAFGCLVLELASGSPPWYDLDATEILLKLDAGASPLAHAQSRLGAVPRHFLRVMSLALAPDPSLRPSARDLLEMHFAEL
jgi:mitogen-activated protein kinase kinase kinase